jgi:hypothetical protein
MPQCEPMESYDSVLGGGVGLPVVRRDPIIESTLPIYVYR